MLKERKRLGTCWCVLKNPKRNKTSYYLLLKIGIEPRKHILLIIRKYFHCCVLRHMQKTIEQNRITTRWAVLGSACCNSLRTKNGCMLRMYVCKIDTREVGLSSQADKIPRHFLGIARCPAYSGLGSWQLRKKRHTLNLTSASTPCDKYTSISYNNQTTTWTGRHSEGLQSAGRHTCTCLHHSPHQASNPQ